MFHRWGWQWNLCVASSASLTGLHHPKVSKNYLKKTSLTNMFHILFTCSTHQTHLCGSFQRKAVYSGNLWIVTYQKHSNRAMKNQGQNDLVWCYPTPTSYSLTYQAMPMEPLHQNIKIFSLVLMPIGVFSLIKTKCCNRLLLAWAVFSPYW